MEVLLNLTARRTDCERESNQDLLELDDLVEDKGFSSELEGLFDAQAKEGLMR